MSATTPQPGGSSRVDRPLNTEVGGQEEAERKMLVEEATQAVLNPFERRLVWMRYYDDQTLEEISEKTTLRRDQVSKAIEVAIYKMRVHLT